MEGVGETKGGGVSRPQKSIGWEERAEIICAVKEDKEGKQIGGGGDAQRGVEHKDSERQKR